MKKLFPFLLAVSLAVNAGLALAYLVGPTAGKPTAPAVAAPAAPAKPISPKIDASVWPGLQTADLPDLVARLRAAGFPPSSIRAMLVAQIDESFAARRKALTGDTDNLPFWKISQPDPKTELALRRLSREEQKTLRALLGSDAEANDPLNQVQQGRRLDGLPPGKIGDISRILDGYDEKRGDIYAAGTYAADREKLAALDKAQHAAIAALLTPQELEEYDLRNSDTADSLRTNLAAFNPTEQEFRAIFRLQQAFDENFESAYGIPTPDQVQQRDEAQSQLDNQIIAALAPDRAALYARARVYDYRTTSQLVARLELPPETTDTLWAMQQDIQQRRAAVPANLPRAERTAQLTALAAEAQTKITALLGPGGLTAYKQYGGQWLNNLAPRAAAAPPAAPKP